jgi:hypothetical protein
MRTPEGPSRRSLLLGASAGGLLVVSGGTAAAASPPATDLSVDLPLRAPLLRADGAGWRTGIIDGVDFAMIGLTWSGPRRGGAWVRTRGAGTWSGWQWLPALHDLPDRGTEGPTGTGDLQATAPLWVGPSDAVQVRVPAGRRTDLNLALIHTAAADDPGAERVLLDQNDYAPRPEIRSRRRWGAAESWRSGDPTYNRTIQQVHIHHTATSNDYARGDVPAILRAIYRYHAKNLGWSDIGYNFLVDRFGRIWQGRAGGSGRAVRGAHTLGFNSTSCGIAVIGNLETATPKADVIRSLVHLSAWKLDGYGREPGRRVKVYSHGSDRYPAGESVRLPVIDGHRDTGNTACPGENLYGFLPEIRRRTKRRAERFVGMEWQPT